MADVPKSFADIDPVFFRDGFVCKYCGSNGLADVNAYYTLRVDHFKPRARGGKGDAQNKVSACHACNAFKGAKEFASLDEARAFIARRREQAQNELEAVRSYLAKRV